MTLFVGRVEDVHEGPFGRDGVVSVRGARVEILLDAVPDVRVGDSVLIHAGVALSVLRADGEPELGTDLAAAFPLRAEV